MKAYLSISATNKASQWATGKTRRQSEDRVPATLPVGATPLQYVLKRPPTKVILVNLWTNTCFKVF